MASDRNNGPISRITGLFENILEILGYQTLGVGLSTKPITLF